MANLNFAFLDKNDGVLLEILYCGEARRIVLEGGFKSSDPLKFDGYLTLQMGRSRYSSAVVAFGRAVMLGVGMIGVWTVFVAMVMLSVAMTIQNPLPALERYFIGVLYLAAFSVILGLIVWLFERKPVRLRPRERRIPRVLYTVPIAQSDGWVSPWKFLLDAWQSIHSELDSTSRRR